MCLLLTLHLVLLIENFLPRKEVQANIARARIRVKVRSVQSLHSAETLKETIRPPSPYYYVIRNKLVYSNSLRGHEIYFAMFAQSIFDAECFPGQTIKSFLFSAD